jgi:hypothetical protein
MKTELLGVKLDFWGVKRDTGGGKRNLPECMFKMIFVWIRLDISIYGCSQVLTQL